MKTFGAKSHSQGSNLAFIWNGQEEFWYSSVFRPVRFKRWAGKRWLLRYLVVSLYENLLHQWFAYRMQAKSVFFRFVSNCYTNVTIEISFFDEQMKMSLSFRFPMGWQIDFFCSLLCCCSLSYIWCRSQTYIVDINIGSFGIFDLT